jgi:hypothetical protein
MSHELLKTPDVDTTGMSPTQRFIIQIGVVAAISIYLIIWMTNTVTAQLGHVSEKLDAHVAATELIRQSLQQSDLNQKILINVSQQVCVNAARTPADRSACFEASRPR